MCHHVAVSVKVHLGRLAIDSRGCTPPGQNDWSRRMGRFQLLHFGQQGLDKFVQVGGQLHVVVFVMTHVTNRLGLVDG